MERTISLKSITNISNPQGLLSALIAAVYTNPLNYGWNNGLRRILLVCVSGAVFIGYNSASGATYSSATSQILTGVPGITLECGLADADAIWLNYTSAGVVDVFLFGTNYKTATNASKLQGAGA